MPKKEFNLDGVGVVQITKRRGSRNLKLSVSLNGKVRVNMPYWLPYQAGVAYAQKNRQWILTKLKTIPQHDYQEGEIIGKSHRLAYVYDELISGPSSKIVDDAVVIKSNLPLNHPETVKVIKSASDKALKQQAKEILPTRLQDLAANYGYNYNDLRIRKMTSRWGSCSSQKDITLNYLLMQLPWEMIDYVIAHELVHTRIMNHSPDFWSEFEKVIPDAKKTRKNLRLLQPDLKVF